MKRLLALLLLIPNLAFAQISQQEVLNTIASNLPTNNANQISALLLRNTLDVMISAIFQGVPIQTGTACPPLTGLIPFQFFANTTSTTDTTLNLFDGTSCIKWANINQTTHTMGFVGSSLVTAPTGDSFVDITSAGTKTAVDIYSPFSSMGGTEFDVGRFVLDFEGTNSGTVSQANALGAYAYCNFNSQAASYPSKGNCTSLSGFSIAANTGANAWGIVAFCADNFTSAPYVGGNRSCTHEFDIRIEDTTGTARGTGALLNLVGNGTTSSTLIAADIQNNAATLKWNFGVNCNNNAVLNACINVGTQNTGVSGSQNLAFEYNFTGSAQKAMTMTTPSTGGFVFTTSDAAINVGFDWSAVTFNQCVLKIAFGCSIDGNGNIIVNNITTSHGTIGNINSIWTNDGGVVSRISDRLFVGAAAIVNGGNQPESPKDWLETLFTGATQNSQMTAFSTLGLTGATFASRASDWPTAAQASNSIGAAFYGFANNTTGTLLHGAWGGYGECDKSASVNANCFALELDAANYGSVVDITPSAMFPNAGTTVNLQNGCGGVNGGTASCTAVMTVLANTQKFRKGIVYGAVSLDTGLGTGGGGVAIEMGGGTGAGQSIRWLDASGNLVSEIYGVVATNPFTHFNGGTNGQFSFDINGSAFLGLNSTNVFPNVTNTVSLGAASFRWSTVDSVLGNYSSTVTEANAIMTSAAPTVAAAQIGYGSTVVAAGSGNCPTGTVGTKTVAGCIVLNVAGSTAVVPYF